MVSVCHCAEWQQVTRFQGDVTGPAASDWYGERAEDQARHSLVTEARTYDIGLQIPPLRADPASPSLGQQPAVDHVYPGPARPQMYVCDILCQPCFSTRCMAHCWTG